MWYDKEVLDNEGPPSHHARYSTYLYTWRFHHPHWENKFWNRRRVEELWTDPRLSKWLPMYQKLNHHMEKCDYSRYAILYLYGGVYHDLDVICLQSYDKLVDGKSFLAVREPDGKLVANGLLGSTPGHPYMAKILDAVSDGYSQFKGPVDSTGPRVVTRVLDEIGYKDTLPFEDFFPFGYDGELQAKEPSSEKNYSIAVWSDGTGWNSTATTVTSAIPYVLLLIVLTVILTIWIVYK